MKALTSDEPEESPTRETREFHPDDIRLRAHGYVIVARPNVGEAQWRLGRQGEVIGRAEALRRIKDQVQAR